MGGTGVSSRDITPEWFGFGKLDLLHDIPSDLSLHTTIGSGFGHHVVRKPDQAFDLSVGLMTRQLALTATLSHRYDSRPGAGVGRNDTLFVTGVSLRFD